MDYITILRGISWEMATNIPDKSLDFCFIDADHRYSGVTRDIFAYLPKIKQGGWISGHDCDDLNLANSFTPEELETDVTHAGVIQAIYDIFGTINMFGREAKSKDPGCDKMWYKQVFHDREDYKYVCDKYTV